MYKIPYLDLSINDEKEREQLLKAVEVVLKHGRFILGPEVDKFEKKIAEYCNRKYAVSVASGTDALFLGLRALNIGDGHEIITNAYSWIATANAIYMVGATPVFADILPDLTLDPDSVKKLITEKTRGIIAVNYSGRLCDFKQLESIANKYNIELIEDASQSFGAMRDKRIAGSFGKISCISLNPMKLFGACGEAGVVLTDSFDIKKLLENDRYNGMESKTTCTRPGLNSRIDTLQASILLYRFKNFHNILNKRREIAQFYNEELKKLNIGVFEDKDGTFSSFFSYFIKIEDRDSLLSYLESKGIECKLRDSDYLPMQPAYKGFKTEAFYAKNLYKKLLLIPASEILKISQAKHIVDEIKNFLIKC